MENPIKFIIRTISGRERKNNGWAAWYEQKGARHARLDIVNLRKRRKKNKVARRSRRINQLTRKH